jgi:hypothetical protein
MLSNGWDLMADKPFYEFVGREPNPPYTDRLIWQNRDNPDDRINTSVWWFWRLWRFQGLPESTGSVGAPGRGAEILVALLDKAHEEMDHAQYDRPDE